MISDKDLIIQKLKEKVDNLEELSLENDKNSAMLVKLYDAGVIDEEDELMIKKATKWKCRDILNNPS